MTFVGPSLWYPPGATRLTLPFRVSDPDGVHPVVLTYPVPGGFADSNVRGCRMLAGRTDGIVEFEVDGVPPHGPDGTLSDDNAHIFTVWATDGRGGRKWIPFAVAHRSPYHLATLKGTASEDLWWVAFSPDGGVLASGPLYGAVKLWDVASRRQIATLKGYRRGSVKDLAFSPDGGILAAASGHGRVDSWDVHSGSIVETHVNPGISRRIAFSPDGRTLAAATETWIELWDRSSFTTPRPRVPDWDGDGEVGFGDFVKFAAKYGYSRGMAGYDPRYDLDRDGELGFSDFLIFTKAFGQSV